MIRIITATEATAIDDALDQSYKELENCGLDEEDLEFILEARLILKGLKQKTIEEVLP